MSWLSLALMAAVLGGILLYGSTFADRLARVFVAPSPTEHGTEELPPTLPGSESDTAEPERAAADEEPMPPPAALTSGALLRDSIRAAADVTLRAMTR